MGFPAPKLAIRQFFSTSSFVSPHSSLLSVLCLLHHGLPIRSPEGDSSTGSWKISGVIRATPTNEARAILACRGHRSFGLLIIKEALEGSLNWWFGDSGEKRTLKLLESGLSDQYTAITNYVIPGTKKGDIDLLILGPFGILVVEIKTYAARFACDGDDWVNIKENGFRKRMKSPSRQLKGNVKAMGSYLKRLGQPAPLHGVLVLNDRADVELCNPSVEILKRSQLKDFILDLPHSSGFDSQNVLRHLAP